MLPLLFTSTATPNPKRWSQLRKHSRAGSLAGAKSTFDFMQRFSMFAALALVYPPRRASGR